MEDREILSHIALEDLKRGAWVRTVAFLVRRGFETPGEAVEIGADRRRRFIGYGERSEEVLAEIASLRWLDRADLRRLKDGIRMLDKSPLELCRRLYRRRSGGSAWPLFNRLALKGLERVGLEDLRWELGPRVPEDARSGSRENPMDRFDPRPDGVGAQLKSAHMPPRESLRSYQGFEGLAGEKRRFLKGFAGAFGDWAQAERELFAIAEAILAPRRWSPRAALRFVPSWILCRRVVDRTTGLLFRRRARLVGWRYYHQALDDQQRLSRPGHDEPGEADLWENVRELVGLGPGWPLSSGAFARAGTFEHQFLDSLERLDLRAERVLRLRLAVAREEELILKKAGQKLKLSAERVRQIEEAAWERLEQDESWPGRLRRRLRSAVASADGPVPLSRLRDDWLTGRVLFARPFFELLVKRLMGRKWKVVLHLGEPRLMASWE